MNSGSKISFEPPKKSVNRTLEKEIQNEICMTLDEAIARGVSFDYAGDMNAAKRSPQEAAWCIACGMKSGEPDLRVYVSDGRLILIELKVKGRNSVFKAQRERHERLRGLGHDVRVWRLKNRSEGREMALKLISEICPCQD